MIPISRFTELMMEIQAEVNASMAEELFFWDNGMWIYRGDGSDGGSDTGKSIDFMVISPTESHFVKKVKDLNGIILGVILAPSDTEFQDVDNYAENNNELLFVLEKTDPGRFTDQNELYHYAKLQLVMKYVKEQIIARGMNGNMCGGDETMAKPFHTEWEYNQFGGFNGLSVAFDLKDWSL